VQQGNECLSEDEDEDEEKIVREPRDREIGRLRMFEEV
jgi:hypothetical protein